MENSGKIKQLATSVAPNEIAEDPRRVSADEPTKPTITRAEKERVLEDVLKSRTFCRAERLKALLRFVTEEVLAGRGGDLNEYKIGVEALDRPVGYSPLEDSSVRSRIYEVRKKLDRYYAKEAPESEVRIILPKGSHVPDFFRAQTQAESSSPNPDQNRPAHRAGRRLTRMIAISFFAGALVMLLLSSFLRTSGLPIGASAFSEGANPDPEWGSALEEIWNPLVDASPLLIIFEVRLFFHIGRLTVRDFRQ